MDEVIVRETNFTTDHRGYTVTYKGESDALEVTVPLNEGEIPNVEHRNKAAEMCKTRIEAYRGASCPITVKKQQ